MNGRDLFSRHLDLSRVRGSRGVVPCIFHKDPTPSLSVDLDRGLFNCFGCGMKGGVRRFAEFVGELPAAVSRREVAPGESELQRARRRVMEDERRRQARMAEWWPYLRGMAWMHRQERAIQTVRATAADDEAGWSALDDAATLERYVESKTAEIEAILAVGRVA